MLESWPKEPGFTFALKAGWSALDAAWKFARSVRTAAIVGRSLHRVPTHDEPYASQLAIDECGPDIKAWSVSALNELAQTTMPLDHVWPTMGEIHRDGDSIQYKLEDEYTRALLSSRESHGGRDQRIYNSGVVERIKVPTMSTTLKSFMEKCGMLSFSQVGYALAFIWFQHRSEPSRTFSATELVTALDEFGLRNDSLTTREFYAQLKTHPAIGQKGGRFSIRPTYISELDEYYQPLTGKAQATHTERAELTKAPFLSQDQIGAALRMAELYVILHCYENSARELIRSVLTQAFGSDWWESTTSMELKRKVDDRKAKEQRQRWISPRGSSPLVYLDWGDLLTLIRKHQDHFKESIHEYKFVELRFEELERFRNIIAHNGILPSEDEFQRVVLSFREWCKQVGT